jgi:hypothetical protein
MDPNAYKGDSMLNRTFQLLLVACLATGTLWAADDPFAGKWKVNPSQSKLTDEMKVEAAGANRYAITFGPGAIDTIVADGSDQPGLRGTTLAVTVEGPNNWKVVRKKDGHMLISAEWTLSADSKTLTDAYTGYQSDGSTMSLHYVYQRTAGSSGFTGTWDSVSEQVESSIELEIQPYEGDGLSFDSPSMRMAQKIKFDGNDYPDIRPDLGPGYASSGRRENQRTLELTDKYQGKITATRKIELSPDLKTLTMSVRPAGESKPKNIFVFDRE